MMSQVDDLCFKEIAFGGLQFEPMFPESAKNNSHALEVFLRSRGVHYYIIEVDKAIGQVQLPQAILHEALEGSRSALQRLKGILSHSNRPILPRVKAVNCFDSSAMGTCQNPDVKSKVEKWAEPTKLSRLSPI